MIDFDEWCEENDDYLWAEYHESGACYDSEYEDWLEYKYEWEVMDNGISK